MNEKRLPPRLMVLLVVLKGEKVYKVPIRSEIKLDHLKDFNTLRKYEKDYLSLLNLRSYQRY